MLEREADIVGLATGAAGPMAMTAIPVRTQVLAAWQPDRDELCRVRL
jgi:hypothetical protein